MESMNKYTRSHFSSNDEVISRFFQRYDQNNDGFLDLEEFENFVRDNFECTENSKKDMIVKIFQLLDENQDGKLDAREWQLSWCYWLRQVLKPVSALLVIDVQNDFICGSLALCNCPAGQDGTCVIPVINELIDQTQFDVVVYSLDWHPENHISFFENVQSRPLHPSSKVTADEAQVTDTVRFAGPPVIEQTLWPKHCVQNSKGAELHPSLTVVEGSYTVHKGTNPEVDSYSAFWDNNKQSQTDLVKILAKNQVTDVYVCGLAYDVCVGFTTLHSVEHGFRTVLIEDACRGVSLSDIDCTRQKLIDQGVQITTSDKIQDLVSAKARPLTLALKAAQNFALARKIARGHSQRH